MHSEDSAHVGAIHLALEPLRDIGVRRLNKVAWQAWGVPQTVWVGDSVGNSGVARDREIQGQKHDAHMLCHAHASMSEDSAHVGAIDLALEPFAHGRRQEGAPSSPRGQRGNTPLSSATRQHAHAV